MRKAEIAESILSLVMEPERSASAVGDLTEEAGAVGFWISIARIFAGALWNPFRTDLARVARLTALGLVIELAATAAMLVMVVAISALIGYLEGALWGKNPGAYMQTFTAAPGMITLVVGTLLDFQAGRWIAKLSPGREIGVCLAAGISWWILEQIVNARVNIASEIPISIWTFLGFLPAVAFFAGAVMVRSKSLKGSATAS